MRGARSASVGNGTAWTRIVLAAIGLASAPAFAQEADAPATTPAPPAAATAESQPTPQQPPASFSINAFDVVGARTLDQSAIEDAVYPFAGPDKTTVDVEAARKALQDAYKSRGFETVQVDVPPQPQDMFAAGIVQLRVTEAPVAKVTVSGAKYHSAERVRRDVPALAEGQALNLKTFQTQVDAANRFPDRTLTPSFEAGAEPGTINVDLAVEDALPYHFSLELNNDHSPSTDPLRLNASARFTNLWGAGHTVNATYIVAPENRKQTEVISGSYTAPLIGTPLTFVLYGYKSNSNVAALGGVNVLGDGYQVGGRVVYRVPTAGSMSANVTLGLDYKDFKQNVSLSGALASRAPIKYVPGFAGAGVSMGDDKYNFDFNVSSTFGLRILKRVGCFAVTDDENAPCIPVDQFKNKDFDSIENFVHFNVDLTYRRVLPKDFLASYKFFGQIADSHLVTNEQFAIGGLQSVRGYLQSEGVGDTGYAQMVELATPSIAPILPKFVDELRGYLFVDGGVVRILSPLPDVTSRFAFVSVGAGARIKLFNHFTGEIAVGVPLRDGPYTNANDIRTTFSAKGEF